MNNITPEQRAEMVAELRNLAALSEMASKGEHGTFHKILYLKRTAAADALEAEPAARELIEKAARLDEIESCAKELYEVLKETYQDQDSDPLRVYCLALASGLASSWLVGKIENGFIVGLNHATEGPITVEFRKENGKTLIESNLALRARLRESEALVERLKDAATKVADSYQDLSDSGDAGNLRVATYPEMIELRNALALTPAAALDQYRAEVLEKEAQYCESFGDFETADQLRRRKGTPNE